MANSSANLKQAEILKNYELLCVKKLSNAKRINTQGKGNISETIKKKVPIKIATDVLRLNGMSKTINKPSTSLKKEKSAGTNEVLQNNTKLDITKKKTFTKSIAKKASLKFPDADDYKCKPSTSLKKERSADTNEILQNNTKLGKPSTSLKKETESADTNEILQNNTKLGITKKKKFTKSIAKKGSLKFPDVDDSTSNSSENAEDSRNKFSARLKKAKNVGILHDNAASKKSKVKKKTRNVLGKPANFDLPEEDNPPSDSNTNAEETTNGYSSLLTAGGKLKKQFINFAKLGNMKSGKTISMKNTTRWLSDSGLLNDYHLTVENAEKLFTNEKKERNGLTIFQFIEYVKKIAFGIGVPERMVIQKLIDSEPPQVPTDLLKNLSCGTELSKSPVTQQFMRGDSLQNFIDEKTDKERKSSESQNKKKSSCKQSSQELTIEQLDSYGSDRNNSTEETTSDKDSPNSIISNVKKELIIDQPPVESKSILSSLTKKKKLHKKADKTVKKTKLVSSQAASSLNNPKTKLVKQPSKKVIKTKINPLVKTIKGNNTTAKEESISHSVAASLSKEYGLHIAGPPGVKSKAKTKVVTKLDNLKGRKDEISSESSKKSAFPIAKPKSKLAPAKAPVPKSTMTNYKTIKNSLDAKTKKLTSSLNTANKPAINMARSKVGNKDVINPQIKLRKLPETTLITSTRSNAKVDIGKTLPKSTAIKQTVKTINLNALLETKPLKTKSVLLHKVIHPNVPKQVKPLNKSEVKSRYLSYIKAPRDEKNTRPMYMPVPPADSKTNKKDLKIPTIRVKFDNIVDYRDRKKMLSVSKSIEEKPFSNEIELGESVAESKIEGVDVERQTITEINPLITSTDNHNACENPLEYPSEQYMEFLNECENDGDYFLPSFDYSDSGSADSHLSNTELEPHIQGMGEPDLASLNSGRACGTPLSVVDNATRSDQSTVKPIQPSKSVTNISRTMFQHNKDYQGLIGDAEEQTSSSIDFELPPQPSKGSFKDEQLDKYKFLDCLD